MYLGRAVFVTSTMRVILLATFVAICGLASSTVVNNPTATKAVHGVHGVQSGYQGEHHSYKIGDKGYLKWYKDVLRLLKYVHQPTYFKDHVDVAKEWHIENHMNDYTKSEYAKQFLHYYHLGMLPKDQIFSVFYDYHLEQAISLFKLFYYAKDFETFYNTAVWARYYLNQGMFLYAYSVALIHRHDTYNMVLPPIYEIYPYYFFNTEIIHKAQYYKQTWTNSAVDDNKYLIYGNYSGWYLNEHPEQSISYFTEDIGVNAYYYYYNLYRPFWMDSEEYHLISYYRGEEFYYFYQQLLARYYLERLSNDMGTIPTYDYDDAFETGYYPSLCYPNGMEFPERPSWVYFFSNYYNHQQSYAMKGRYPYSYYLVQDYEKRIRDAIDAGYVYTESGEKVNIFEPHGFNTLGNIIEGNQHSPNKRFYGYLQMFVRHLLGYSYQPLHHYKIAPSALQHFETSIRDPAFWMFFKRMILYFQKYKYYLPYYTYDELVFSGVKVEGLEISHLYTYFDYYDSDITNAVYMNQHEFEHNTFNVYTRQWRLNHKPFTYNIKVISDKAAQSVVRVFIGPKYDEYGRFIHIDENRLNFVEFDRFIYDLKPGQNMIERSSKQIFYGTDRTIYKQLYQWAMNGMTGEDFMTHGSEIYYAFPNRFLLPKGKYGGQVYQFYVIISPYKSNTNYGDIHQKYSKEHPQKPQHGTEYEFFKYPMVGLGVQYLDDYPLGYPFDRPINELFFYVPNAYFQDVIIYHKHMDHIDSKMWWDNKKGMEFLGQATTGVGVNVGSNIYSDMDLDLMHGLHDGMGDIIEGEDIHDINRMHMVHY